MKILHRSFALLFLTIVLSGCSTCPCTKKAEAQAPVAQPVVVQAAPAPVVSAPASKAAAPAEEPIPAAVRK